MLRLVTEFLAGASILSEGVAVLVGSAQVIDSSTVNTALLVALAIYTRNQDKKLSRIAPQPAEAQEVAPGGVLSKTAIRDPHSGEVLLLIRKKATR